MFRPFAFALLSLVALGGGASAEPTHKIAAADRQKVTATITYEIRTTDFAVNRWMIFMPVPPDLPSQHSVKSTGAPAGKVVKERSLLARDVRFIDIPVRNPAPGSKVTVQIDIEAVLRSRKLVAIKPGEKPPAVPALTDNEKKYYLSPTMRVDFDAKAFQGWLDANKLRLESAEHPLDFAARVLEVIRAGYAYHYDPYEDKRASVACRAKGTDCGGMSYMFVGAMRANGIPARVLAGRTALPRRPDSTPAQTDHDHPHMRAEFYMTGIGWVPVDAAHAHGAKRRPVTDYIGNDPGDLLVLHADVDLRLPFPDQERVTQCLQIDPYYYATGRGNFDGMFGPTGWELKATPITKK